MKPAATLFVLAAAGFTLLTSLTVPAQAQNLRSWVSGVGDDNNACTRTAPCQSFTTAFSKTWPGGEIDCLDPGSFGLLIITKSITIDCGSGETGSIGSINAANGAVAITVNAGPDDVVQIRKLTIDGISGSQFGGASFGIQFISAKSVHVDNVNIMNFAKNGVDIEPTAKAAIDVVNSNIMNCANNGVGIAVGGSGLVRVSLKGVRMSQGGNGLRAADNASATLHVSIDDSIASSNSGSGFVATTGGGRLTMQIDRSVSTNNDGTGVIADGGNTETHLSNTKIFGNSTGVSTTNGASLLTYKNNEIKLNGSNGSPTGVVGAD